MKVAILGGGISGLSAAWYLLRKVPSAQIQLFEASHRLGGYVETKEQDGFLFEQGPRTFQKSRCPKLLALIYELGLKPIFSEKVNTKYLWYKEALRPLSSFWPEMLRACLQDLVAPRGKNEEETIEAFARRRMGKKAAALFFDPMTKGVFGGDMSKLSLKASFPILFEAEKNERSIVKWMLKQKRGEAGLFTLASGMESLINALKQLPMTIYLETAVENITAQGVVSNGQFYPADLIISALPGLEIARLTNVALPLYNQSLSVVNFGFYGDILSKKGYGYLVPGKENILGQIWDSSIFPVLGQTKLSSMVIGENPIDTALDALKRHLGVSEAPLTITCKKALIPQYMIGHLVQIDNFEKKILSQYGGKIQIVGNYLSGASVEACLCRSSQIIHTNC